MDLFKPIGSMYGIYANIWGILMVNVTIYGIHGSYGKVLLSSNIFHCGDNCDGVVGIGDCVSWPLFNTQHLNT